MSGRLKTIWHQLTRTRHLSLSGLKAATVPAAELAIGIVAVGSWSAGVGLTGGIVGIAVLSAFGISRAMVRRRARLKARDPDVFLETLGRVGEAGRDFAYAGVFSILPCLIIPTAGYMLGMGHVCLGLGGLLAGMAAFLPISFFAKEGILRLAQKPGSHPELASGIEGFCLTLSHPGP